MYLSDIYTIATNLAGLPGMSVPVAPAAGMPVGLQVIGNYFDEARLLNVAHRLQQATDWHLKTPALATPRWLLTQISYTLGVFISLPFETLS